MSRATIALVNAKKYIKHIAILGATTTAIITRVCSLGPEAKL